MASMPSIPAATPAPSSTRERPTPAPSVQAKTRAERLADAHAWVLEHHAETFEKLSK
jgi:hypothetical protein